MGFNSGFKVLILSSAQNYVIRMATEAELIYLYTINWLDCNRDGLCLLSSMNWILKYDAT